MSEYRRDLFHTVHERLHERRRFLQVLSGPRQAGKTTLTRQVLAELDLPWHYASADDPAIEDRAWLQAQWELGRLRARDAGRAGALLVIDEVQKVTGWSETVKRLWDEDTAADLPLRVALLVSAPLLVGRGLAESLAGRFEVIRVPHWSLSEMRDAFGFDLDTFVFHGGYPGAAPLVDDLERWRAYVLDALVETTLSRDVLLLSRIDKPALLRQLFRLACDYSGQILSYNKMLGTLQDAGNTTTLAHYLDLLAGAGLVTGLGKHAVGRIRRRGSSPKLQVLNTALMTAHTGLDRRSAHEDHAWWGRLLESAVGAHLLNSAGPGTEVSYWRERGDEVDFVVTRGATTVAIEVKSSAAARPSRGLDAFAGAFPVERTLLIGAGGMPIEELLLTPTDELL